MAIVESLDVPVSELTALDVSALIVPKVVTDEDDTVKSVDIPEDLEDKNNVIFTVIELEKCTRQTISDSG